MNKAKKYQLRSGSKIEVQVPPDVSDEVLHLWQQLGVEYCYTWIEPDQMNEEFVSNFCKRCEKYGLTVYSMGTFAYGKSEEIHLGLEKRDEHIKKFNDFLGVLSRANIHTTTVTWFTGSWATTEDGRCGDHEMPGARAPLGRGGAMTRKCDDAVIQKAPSFKITYSKEEMWKNFRYFLEKVIPVAEKEEVRIALHPNDPPWKNNLGIEPLIDCLDDYREAFRLAKSDFFGMEMCLGCWLEGGEEFYGDLIGSIKEFVKENKVFVVHFRNVSSAYPCFIETFLNDGYADMTLLMEALVESGYDGIVNLDHALGVNGDIITSEAYSIGYMQGLLQYANRLKDENKL